MSPIRSWDEYFIPGTDVLANKLGATTKEALLVGESALSGMRIAELLSSAQTPISLNYNGFQDIHRHIFQDVYEWAGEPRCTPAGWMSKTYRDVVNYPAEDLSAPDTEYRYCPGPFVAAEATKRFALLDSASFLQGLSRRQFVASLAEHWAEVNAVHPFREGNTRTQIVYFASLATEAGHPLNTLGLLEAGRAREEFLAARFHAQVVATYERLVQFLSDMID